MTTCLNCDNNFEGLFCNLCGQKAATHRFTMHEWLHEIPHSILHVDSGFFLTMKTLFLRPGDAVREFLQGKRKLLFSPFLYVLILCGVYVVVTHFFGKDEKVIEVTNISNANEYISEHYYKIWAIVSVIPLAVGSYFAYFKSGYNFAEHLVFNAYLMGQLVIADIILVLISATNFDENYSPVFKSLEFIIKFPFWFWMIWQFFKPRKWYWGILQFILFLILASIATFILLTPFGFYVLKMKGSH